jgi:hypothetical protein
VRRRAETLGVARDITLLRVVALVPLFFFGELALFCGAFALAHVRNAGPALTFGVAALLTALGYPLLVELERHVGGSEASPRPPWRLGICDACFAAGGVFAAWKLDGRPGAPATAALLGLVAALWLVAGVAARMVARRGDAPAPSKER